MLHGMPKLEIILASDNQINSLNVEGLINTPQLATLDLQNNDLMQIPPQLGNCTQLRYALCLHSQHLFPIPWAGVPIASC